jgi:MFS family permease
VLVAIDLLYTFLPVWATERSIDPRIVGMLLAERAAVSVLSRLGLGRLVAVLGRRRLLTAAIAGSALALAALPFCGVAGAIIVMAVAGCGLGIPQPVTMSWVVSLTAPHLQGTALGLRLTANTVAQLTYPAIIGAAANPFGAVGVFAMTAGLLAVSVFLVAPFRD